MSTRVILALTVLAASTVAAAEAQRRPSPARAPMQIELSGGYAYQFGGAGQTREGKLEVTSSGSYGFTLDIPVRQDARIELLWWRQDAQAEFRRFSSGGATALDVAVEYWQLGGMTEFPQGNLAPYVVLTLGTTRLVGKENASGDEFRFGGTLGGGVKIAGQGAVGIRLEGRLLLTARNSGSSFWCGTGGCAIGVVGNPIAQGVLSGSVFVKVGGPR